MPHPDRKISETFLDYASPLIDALGPNVTKEQFDQALKIAFTVWNSVVFDQADGDARYAAKAQELTGGDPAMAALVEYLIRRKQSSFANDQRLIGEYSLIRKSGEWRLRVEARAPSVKH